MKTLINHCVFIYGLTLYITRVVRVVVDDLNLLFIEF